MRSPANSLDAPFTTAPHLTSPEGEVAAWFTNPPGAVIRLTRSARLALPHAQWLAGPALAALDRRFGSERPLILVLDLQKMTSRDPAVRPVLVDTTKSLRPRLARAFLIPPEEAPAVYLASLRAAASLLRVFGVEVEVHASLGRLLGVVSLRPAVPD